MSSSTQANSSNQEDANTSTLNSTTQSIGSRAADFFTEIPIVDTTNDESHQQLSSPIVIKSSSLVRPLTQYISPLHYFKWCSYQQPEQKSIANNKGQSSRKNSFKSKNKNQNNRKLRVAQNLLNIGHQNNINSAMATITSPAINSSIMDKTIQVTIENQRNHNDRTIINYGAPFDNSCFADDITIKEIENISQSSDQLLNDTNCVNSNSQETSINLTIPSDCNEKLFNNQLDRTQGFSEAEKSNSLLSLIVEEEFPDSKDLNEIHLNIVRKLVKYEIDEIPVNDIVPRFEDSYVKNGVIVVVSADLISKEWLTTTISNLHPQQNVKLKVITIDDLNKLHKCGLIVLDEEDAIIVLKRIKKQNPEVPMNNWQLYSQRSWKTRKGLTYLSIYVGIPGSSIKILKTRNYKLFHGMEQITVDVKVSPLF